MGELVTSSHRVPREGIHIAEQLDPGPATNVGISQAAAFVEMEGILAEEAEAPVDWSMVEVTGLTAGDIEMTEVDGDIIPPVVGKGMPRARRFMPQSDGEGRHRVRPDRHTMASVALGLEEPRHPLRGRAIKPAVDYKKGDGEVSVASDRITHKGDRVVHVSLPQPRPERGVYRQGGGNVTEDANGAGNHSVGVREDAVVWSIGDSKPIVDGTAGRDAEVDALTLCREQSLRAAGDQAILGDELIDRVVGEGGRANVGGNISLDALRASEAEADAIVLFEYAATAVDLRE